MEAKNEIPPVHFECLANIEQSYWWHLSRLNWVKMLIQRECSDPAQLDVLDYGCGTGGLLKQLNCELNFKSCEGVDISYQAVQMAQKHGLQYRQISPNDFSPVDNKDLVFLMDTLEHIEHDKEFLKGLINRLKPGARILMSVPALSFLYSNWDVTLGHYRRYAKKQLVHLVGKGQGKILSSYYVFSYLVPAILIKRIIRGQKYSSKACEFPPTPKLLNDFLVKLNELEIYFSRFVKIPFGSSLFCLIEKP